MLLLFYVFSVLRVAKQLPLGLPLGCFLNPLAPPPLLLLPYFLVYRQPICPSITVSLSLSKIETSQRLMHAQGQHALSQASTGMIVRASQAIHHDESKMLVLQSCSFTTKGLSETYLVAFLVFVILCYFPNLLHLFKSADMVPLLVWSLLAYFVDMWSGSIKLSGEPFLLL